MSDKILEMKNITKSFGGVAALKNVSFSLGKGEIRALIGENGAGKSTLMKILLGIHKKDSGEIIYKGERVEFEKPEAALLNGISMIHQEISLIPEMTVAENIWLGREKKYSECGFWINNAKRNKDAVELLKELEINVDSLKQIKDLSVAETQLVELARAVSYDPSLIIMDEPTSALADAEIKILFEIVRKLAKKGVSVIFVSHKLEEIYTICESITVMRDGAVIDTKKTEDLPMNELINLIAGRKMTTLFDKIPTKLGGIALEVKGLCSDTGVNNVDLHVRKGEVLGLCGLMGAGRSEILRAIFGIDKKQSGEISIEGKAVTINSTTDAVKNGLAMVTEDRLRMGTIGTMSVMGNTTLANFSKICKKGGFFTPKDEEKMFEEVASDLSVKYDKPSSMIGSLSGGNQQKVIIGKWMLTNPKILLLDEPTRGIDVGSKSEIYKLIDDLAKKGLAIIMVSSELPEILALSDRIEVVRDGRIVCECTREEATQEALMSHAFGVAERM